MSSNRAKQNAGSSTYMRNVKGKTNRTRTTLSGRARSLTTSSLKEVESSDSSSPLDKVYQGDAFRLGWDNNLAYHVAENAIRLRRMRCYSQALVAKHMGTSQSKVARIEGGDENITISTLVKLVGALRGRLRFAIEPAEVHLPHLPQWWDMVGNGLHSDQVWNLHFTAVSDKRPDVRAAVAGFVTKHQMHFEVIDADVIETVTDPVNQSVLALAERNVENG